MAIKLAGKCINDAYTGNRNAVNILAVFILILIIVGIVFGVLALFVEVKWAFLEFFVVPVLGYLVKQLVAVTRNNPEILDKAKGILQVANNQTQVAQIIREEKESEKQLGG